MKNFINKQLVNAVSNNIKTEENLVDVVMSVLSLGKEAAYRRIRGEVPFTFYEAVKLSTVFRISLDYIVGVSLPDVAVMNTRFINSSNMYEDYKHTLDTHITMFREMNASSRSRANLAFNTIPFTFYSSFEGLSKFKIFRWMHQMDMLPSGISFTEMKVEDDIWKLQLELVQEVNAFEDICYVLDRNIFLAFVNEINHFTQLGLLSTEDRQLIKKELLSLLGLMEKLVREGGTAHNNVSIYISNIEIDSSYCFYEAEEFNISSFRVFSVNTMHTLDSNFCETQKKWIESFKRYSVLISGCGEMERVKFISKQREIINSL